MEQIFGKGVSKGAAAGPISFYRRPSGEIPRRSVTDTAAELARFHDAERDRAAGQVVYPRLYHGGRLGELAHRDPGAHNGHSGDHRHDNTCSAGAVKKNKSSGTLHV